MTNLEQEFNYYVEHQDELVKEYEGKYIVIKDRAVVGVYSTEIEAYNESKSKYAVGTFLIQPCMPGAENYTQTFHSRVLF